MSKKRIDQKRLKEVLHYNPKTGIFTWKINKKRAKKGDVVNTFCKGYIIVSIDGFRYKTHRLAWFYVYGYFPKEDIDHKDRIKHHNWISNLRIASRSDNMKNTKNRKDNKTGINGVRWNKPKKRWKVAITTIYVGQSKSFDEAVCMRLAAEQCLGWEKWNFNSSAYKYVQNMINKQ